MFFALAFILLIVVLAFIGVVFIGGTGIQWIATGYFATGCFLAVFAVIAQLKIGLYLTLLILLALFIIALIKAVRTKQIKRYLLLTLRPGLVLYLLICLGLMRALTNTKFVESDEFSHWGRVAKLTYFQNATSLWHEPKNQFSSYPPGLSIIEYFFLSLKGKWSEGACLFSIQALILAMVLAFTTLLRWQWNKIPVYLAIGLLSFMICTVATHFQARVYSDIPLGITFGYCLGLAILNKRKMLWHLMPALAFLPFIKDSGFLLGIIVVVYLAICEKKKISLQAKWIYCLISLLFLAGIWRIGLRFVKIPPPWGGLTVEVRGVNLQTVRNFVAALAAEPITEGAISPGSMILLLVITAALYFIGRHNYSTISTLKISKVIWVTIFGFFAYALGILYVYLFKFSEYEATKLASLGRYLETYFVGCFVVLAAFVIDVASSRSKRMQEKAPTAILVYLVVLSLISPIKSLMDIPSGLQTTRSISAESYYLPVVESLEKCHVKKNDHILLILSPVLGDEITYMKYLLLDYQVVGGDLRKEANSPLQIAASSSEFKKILGENSWVYILKTQDRFISDYSEYIQDPKTIKPHTLHKIEKINSNFIIMPAQCT